MNNRDCQANLDKFLQQSAHDGRNFPLKAEGNVILGDDSPDVHQPHNGFGYLMHCGWAARKLASAQPWCHADFGSYLYFAAIASAIVAEFKYHDIRPYNMPLQGLTSISADLTKLPYEDEALESVSCLHVLEHVGLGRYGDQVDSMGDVKAARELARVLAPGGYLIFVVPVNRRAGVVWNAHRHYTYAQVLDELFPDLILREFTLVTQLDVIVSADPDNIVENPGNVEDTGCFWFQKP
jgi:SAM-dependent methyltransferase